MRFFVFFMVGLISNILYSQDISGPELLKKAIKYHDPNNKWPSFDEEFTVTMSTPNSSDRISKIKIDLPSESFSVAASKDGVTTKYILDKGECRIMLNGKTTISEEELKKHNLSCGRATMYKNYYTYLYGLPMKLKDPGTIINPSVLTKTFNDKQYLVLEVSYDKNVGSDIWYFYFDPKTYALEVYQFFKTDSQNSILKESGEYIMLSEIKTINDIKMPKIRKWYYNKDDKYLGTDTLN